MIDDKAISQLESLLTWTSKRQQALAGNVANMDTPGYRAKDFSFSDHMKTLAMSGTAAGHIAPVKSEASVTAYDVDSPIKTNGNSVNLERELTEITKNGLQYITLVQYLNQKLRTLRNAINDGGKV